MTNGRKIFHFVIGMSVTGVKAKPNSKLPETGLGVLAYHTQEVCDADSARTNVTTCKSTSEITDAL